MSDLEECVHEQQNEVNKATIETLSSHAVSTTKINPRRYVCDKHCIGWKTYNVCAHCLATAEDKEFDSFLAWFAYSKGKDSNLAKAVYHDTYKHAG